LVCASPQYIKNYGQVDSLSELDHHNCLLGTLSTWRFKQSGREKKFKVSGNLRFNSGLGLLDAALKGIGIVQLPDFYVQQHLKQGKLVSLLEQFRASDEGVWAVYPQNRHLSPKVRMLIDLLVEKLE